MWMRQSIRDLVEALAAAAPDAGEGLSRTREETVNLLVALMAPLAVGGEAKLREDISRSLDAVLAERRPRLSAIRAA